MGEWDGQMKHLVSIAREDFVSWLVEGAALPHLWIGCTGV